MISQNKSGRQGSYMKKKIALTLIFSLFLCVFQTASVSASSINPDNNIISTSVEYFEDGSYNVIELYENNNGISLFSSVKAATRTVTRYSSSGEALCALKLVATFSYDGSTVSCTSTDCTKYSYNNSWSVENITTSHSSTSTSKASATANCNFVNKLLGITVKSISASVTINCDVNGNLS